MANESHSKKIKIGIIGGTGILELVIKEFMI